MFCKGYPFKGVFYYRDTEKLLGPVASQMHQRHCVCKTMGRQCNFCRCKRMIWITFCERNRCRWEFLCIFFLCVEIACSLKQMAGVNLLRVEWLQQYSFILKDTKFSSQIPSLKIFCCNSLNKTNLNNNGGTGLSFNTVFSNLADTLTKKIFK